MLNIQCPRPIAEGIPANLKELEYITMEEEQKPPLEGCKKHLDGCKIHLGDVIDTKDSATKY